MEKIENLFRQKLEWNYDPDNIGYYFTDNYDRESCWLRMNDYPEELMWTLYLDGESLDFDYEPSCWKINYITG